MKPIGLSTLVISLCDTASMVPVGTPSVAKMLAPESDQGQMMTMRNSCIRNVDNLVSTQLQASAKISIFRRKAELLVETA